VGGHNNSPLMQHGCVRAGCLPACVVVALRPCACDPLCADKAAQHATSSPLAQGIDIVVVTYIRL